MKLRYTYRLRPGAVAVRALQHEESRNRWVWNQAVAARKQRLARFDDKALTAARKEHDWLAAGSVVAQQQTLRDFYTGNTARRKFRSKRDSRTSLNYTLRGFSLKAASSSGNPVAVVSTAGTASTRLVVAGKIVLPVVWSRELPSTPSSVRVYEDALGHWWASFVVDVAEERFALPASDKPIGIDWGVSTIATTTDPDYNLPHPQLGRKHAAQLAAAQRRMARRKPAPGKPASHGYRKAKKQTARVYEHVKNSRQEIARLWAGRIVEHHSLIAVEDFKPKFLGKSTMARKAADAAIGLTKTTLIEYATRGGRQVVLVPPAYTTMDCSACGARAKTRLSLSQRVFRCEYCPAVLDRDVNAARNILARAGSDPAGADGVRRLPGRVSELIDAA